MHCTPTEWRPTRFRSSAPLLLAAALALAGCSTPGPILPPPPGGAVVVSRALEDASTYQVGNDRSVLSRADAYVAQAGPTGRRGVEQELLTLLSRPGLPEGGKDYVLRLLQLVGSPASVPALALLLEDPRWGDAALNALAAVPGHEADLALLRALSEARGERLLALVRIVGQRRIQASVPALSGLAGAEDPVLAETALRSLGLVGNGEAVLALLRLPVLPSFVTIKRAAAVEAMSRAAQAGGLSAAVKAQISATCRQLVSGEAPATMKLACLKSLQQVEGPSASPMLVGALRSPEPELATGAVSLVLDFPSDVLRAELTRAWPALTPSLRIALIGGLSAAKDPATRSLALPLLETREPGLVTAGLRALAQSGTAQDFDRLLSLAKAGDAQSSEAAAALAHLSDPAVSQRVRDRLMQAEATEAAMLLEVGVARGDRQIFDIACAFIEAGTVRDQGLRSAALEAIAAQARPGDMPRLTALLLSLSAPAEMRTLVRSLQSLAPAHESSGEASSMLLLAVRDADAVHRRALRLVLASLDTPEAVAYLGSSLSLGNEDEWREQVRVLGESRQMAHFDSLFGELPKVPSGPDRKLLLGSLVTLVSQSRTAEPARRGEACETLWSLLSRDEDRLALLAVLEPIKPDLARKLRAAAGL